MVTTKITRRGLLTSMALLGLSVPLLPACRGAPATAPTAGTSSVAAPTTAQATEATAAPTTAAAAVPASQAAPSKAGGSLSIAVMADPTRKWQNHWAEEWAKQHPEVKLQIVEILYNDMAKKQLAELATGELQDVVFNANKWIYYSAYKGAFLPLDSYVKGSDPGMDDFIPVAITSCTFEGKLYGLPFEVNTGNANIIVYNKDLFDKKKVAYPTDEWTMDEFADIATKLTDKQAHVFGTNYFPGTYYDFGALCHNLGGSILSTDDKKFTLTTDPKSVKSAQWAVDLQTKYHVAPSRAESKGLEFPAGQIAIECTGLYAIASLQKTVANKFKYDYVLGPTGPKGLRGFDSFVAMWSA